MSTRPPFGDATDEAVSALLDGELDDFAVAHGTTEDDARRELAAWPGFEARRRELERARGALAMRDEPLDDLDRRRLVHNAAAAGPQPHRRSRRRTAGLAAAAVVVLAAAGFGLSRLGGGTSSSSKASKSSAAAALPPNAYVGDVGEVVNTDVLRALVSQQQAGLPVHAPGEFATPDAARQGTASRTPQTPSTTTPAQAAAARTDATRCAGTVAGRDPVTFLATGTYQGQPAVIVGVHRGARTVAFVLDRSACTVLTAASL